MVPNPEGTEFGFTKSLDMSMNDYACVVRETRNKDQHYHVDAKLFLQKPLCNMVSIASLSPAQDKPGPRIEKRTQQKELYRLNRLRPPEKVKSI